MKLNLMHKNQFKVIKYLNLGPEAKNLEENMEEKLLDIDLSNDFFF